MATQNSINLKVTNNADGYDVSGGATPRKLTLTGADIILTGSGSNTYTFPSSTSTLLATDGALSALTGTITSTVLGNSTIYIGTTGIALNRATATLNLAGIGTLGVGAITSSGTLTLGANNITSTGSLGATGAGKLTKLWATDAEITNLPTINGGTLASALNLSGTNTGDVVKATGAEVDTGTNDAKFATPKAFADSKYFKSDETKTLTNKRITARVKTFATDATPDIDSDDYDAVTITAQAVAITDVNVTGTPTNFQKLLFRIKDNATARAITWGSDFEAGSVALPTTTEVSKTLMAGFIYDSVDSKWACEASDSRA